MKNSKNVLLTLFILSFSFFISCTQVPIKNHLYCGDAGPLGASCFESQTDVAFDLSPTEWDEKRFNEAMICTSATSFSEDTATLLKACRSCRCCTYDVKRKLLKFKKNIKAFQKQHQKMKQD